MLDGRFWQVSILAMVALLVGAPVVGAHPVGGTPDTVAADAGTQAPQTVSGFTAFDGPVIEPDSDDDGLNDSRERELGTDPYDADTDNDTYKDGWEVQQEGPGGVALPGADPLSMDVWLQITPTEGHKTPSESYQDSIRGAFASMPVYNPDGTTGIDVHIRIGDRLNRSFLYNRSNSSKLQEYSEIRKEAAGKRLGLYHHMLVANLTYSSGIAYTGGTDSVVGVAEDKFVNIAIHELMHNLVGELPPDVEERCADDPAHICEGKTWLNFGNGRGWPPHLANETFNEYGFAVEVSVPRATVSPEYPTVGETMWINASDAAFARGRDPINGYILYKDGERISSESLATPNNVTVSDPGEYKLLVGGAAVPPHERNITVYPPVISMERSVGATEAPAGGTISASLSANFSEDHESMSMVDGFSGPIEAASIDAITVDGHAAEDATVRFSNIDTDSLTVALEDIDAGQTVTVEYTLEVAADAATGETVELTGSDDNPDLNAGDVAQDFETRTVSIAESAVSRADTNDDGTIDDSELRTAIVEWSSGGYSDEGLRSIIVAWSAG